ncbi:MAG: hypothetical protein ACKO3R_05775 [bacterium]
MSRRNMSERAMGGLMLCEELGVNSAAFTTALSNPQTTERKALLSFLKEIFQPKTEALDSQDPEKTLKAVSLRENSLKDLDSKLFAYKNGIDSKDGQTGKKSLEGLTKTLGELLKQSGINTREGAVEAIDQIAEKYNLSSEQKKEIIKSLDAQKKQVVLDWFDTTGVNTGRPQQFSANGVWTSTCPHCQTAKQQAA